MGREQIALANLGAVGIVLESFKLYCNHARFFFTVQFTLVLPILIFNSWLQILLYDEPYGAKTPPSPLHPLRPPLLIGPAGSTGGYALHLFLIDFTGPILGSNPVWTSLGFVILRQLVNQACGALWVAAIFYAVGHIYTGSKTVSFLDVLHKIPCLWARLMITWLWLLLSIFAINAVMLAMVLLESSLASPEWIWLPMLVLILTIVYLDMVFWIAEGVSVLEENYGWAALEKSMALLSWSRLWVAVGVLVFWCTMSGFQYLIARQIELGIDARNPWNPLFLIWTVTYTIINMTLHSQLALLSGGVMYSAFKAYHCESIADSRFFLHNKDGYQSCLVHPLITDDNGLVHCHV